MNAIILAAGLGSRLRPLTNDRPKCMVSIMGEPMVERQIRFLKEKGIDNIILVAGYKAKCLNYLIDKYGVKIIVNPLYETVNNIYSLYMAREYFGNTYVIEGDVYLNTNCFVDHLSHSTYFAACKEYNDEWGLICEEDILQKVNIGSGKGPIMSGISYWTRDDANKIKTKLSEVIANGNYSHLFWDNLVVDLLPELDPIRVKIVNDIYEVDTTEDIADVEEKLKAKG